MDDQKQKPEQPEESLFELTRSFLLIIIAVFAFKHSVLDANNIPTASMVPTLKIGDYLFVNRMRYSFRLGISFGRAGLDFDYKLFDFDNPKRGDIITFDPPPNARAGNKTYVKRVIAVPGDRLQIANFKAGPPNNEIDIYQVIVNGQPVPIEYESHREVLRDVDHKSAPFAYLFRAKRGHDQHYVLYERGTPRIGQPGPEFNFGIPGEKKKNSYKPSDYRACEVFQIKKKNGCILGADEYFVMGDNRDQSSDSRAWGFVNRSNIHGKALVIYFSVNWKDNTCDIKDIGGLYKQFKPGGGFISTTPFEYSGDEKEKHCAEMEPASGAAMNETGMQWLKRMFSHRLWRAEVRWDRIGNIIH